MKINSTTTFFSGIITAIIAVYTATVLFVPAPLSAGLVPACGATGACGFCDIVNVFITLGRWLITGGAGLGLLLIVWAGVGMVMSAGNTEKISAAKKQILGVIIGLGIVLAAFQFVTMIIAFVVTPSQLASFSGSQSPEAAKIGSLTDFLGVPWWTICSEKDLRQYQGKPPKANSTADCRFWGDGTVCQNLTKEEEKQLQDQLDKGEKPTGVKRCCSGACADAECVTEQETKTVTQSAVQPSVPAGTLDINNEESVRKYLKDNGVYLQNNKPSCPIGDQVCKGKANVAGLSKSTLDSLIKANDICRCIVITGGTENGHSSHGLDHPNTVDIDYSTGALRALLATGSNYSGNFGTGSTCEGCWKEGADTKCGKITCSQTEGLTAKWIHVEF